jgi:soluble lytic murein transglycosylase-like protein
MRAILAAAVLLTGVSQAAPEPETSAPTADSLHLGGGMSLASIVASASFDTEGDRNAISPPAAEIGTPKPAATTAQTPAAQTPAAPSTPAAKAAAKSTPLPSRKQASTAPNVPLDDVCNTLLTSAQDNDLPVAFFANLIWQESGLRDNIVSSKGALGIAQFMPEVAVESGLTNPFDPLQALPASARLLRELRDQFGNVGFAAAAYNAGAGRVSQWLNRGRTLPRETRDYVMNITGRSVEQWQKAPPDDAALQFTRRLPCRALPVFAELAQAQAQQAGLEQQQVQQAQAQQPDKPKVEAKVKAVAPLKQVRVAEARHAHPTAKHEPERVAENERPRPAALRHEQMHVAERERLHNRHEARERIRRAPQEQRRRA